MHLTKEQIDDLKARLDLKAVIETAVELKRQGKYWVARCPFHANGKERHPSLVVNVEAGLWNCRGGCSLNPDGKSGVNGKSGGDVITFWMKLTGQTFPAACVDLAQRFGITLSGNGKNGHGANGNGSRSSAAAAVAAVAPGHFSLEGSRIPRTLVFSQSVTEWTRQLSTSRQAQEWLEARGLVTKELWRAFKLGYSTGSLEDLSGTEASEARKHLESIGLLNDEGKETMKGRIVFPLFSLNQLPVNVYGRSLKDELHPHHRFLAGELRGLCNQNAPRRGGELLLVESIVCVCSLCEARIFNAMALYGAHGPTEDLLAAIRQHGITSVVVGLDSDETGRKVAPRLVEELRALGLKARAIEWPEKDPNEVLVKHGAEKLHEIVEKLLAPPAERDAARSAAVDTKLLAAPAAPDIVPAPAPANAPASSSTVTQSITPLLTDDVATDVTPTSSETTVAASVREEKSEEPTEATPKADSGVPADAAAPAEASQAPMPQAAPSAPSEALAPDLLSDQLLVRYEDRRYDVMWLESPSPAQLRARTRVDLLPEAALDGAAAFISPLVSFLDTLNLLSARAREHFIRRTLTLIPAASASALPSKDVLARAIEADLIRIAEAGEERNRKLGEKAETAVVLTPERRAKGIAYLIAPELLARLAADLDAMGYVGEGTAKLLGYLVSISRKLPEALSMVILSSSGSGKSALAEVLEKLTPEEDLFVVSRFTASSLYWMGKDALKRKFVSIEERAGSQEADYAIRALQSKRQVTLMVPIKDQATGKLETKLLLVEGPTAFLESTTESQIHFENATRCFETRLDESCEQTKRIQQAQRRAKTPEGKRSKEKADEIASLHRDVQRCLRVVKVAIPYADLLEFPSVFTRARRDHPRFLNLIEVLAFLHQYQRPLRHLENDALCTTPLSDLSEEELSGVYVEASVDDYAAAVSLYAEILSETVTELKRPLKQLLDVITEMTAERSARGESASALLTREIRGRTHLEPRTLQRQLGELLDLEYLVRVPTKQGLASGYRLLHLPSVAPSAFVSALLTPEELQKRIEGRRAARR